MRYLFIGPSLPDAEDRLAGSDVRILPPIAAGDLLRLPLTEGDVVAIVDGYFHRVGAVRHKEIFATLSAGVRVLGSSSIGALRAAEMDRYGMTGVGRVYAEYRDGRIVGDDEVALLHGPAEAGYPAFSEPLVSVRATLEAAERAALIDPAEHRALIDGLATLPYPRRTYRMLGELARATGLGPTRVAVLADFCRDHAVDVKRLDALLLLDRLRADPAEPAARPELSRTWLLFNWELAAGRGPDGGDHVEPPPSDASLVHVCQLFAHDYAEFYRRLVLEIAAGECVRECRPTSADAPAARVAVEHGRHRGFYGDDFGFLSQWTTERERTGATVEELLPTYLVRSFRVGGIIPREAVVERLTGTGVARRAERIRRAAAYVESRVRAADHDSSRLPARRIVDWFAARWNVAPEDIEFAAMDRGLESLRDFLEVARPYYLVGKYEPDLVDFSVLTEAEHVASA